ncbi:hypothetical protein EC9_30330 [Rosistilla ulvae]|uniref:Uncharacterized protein n=1 Tax=Rosistilla ulvae TaxID=1930277 RepID=A0A517M1U3_9BACT|nr:hypothetical protein EC9_30330 [Rosistilla ulvae]
MKALWAHHSGVYMSRSLRWLSFLTIMVANVIEASTSGGMEEQPRDALGVAH